MEQEQAVQNKFLLPLAIVVAGGLVAMAIYFGGGSGGLAAAGTAKVNPSRIQLEEVSEKDHIVGSRTAPVIVVEYSDTECPFCKVFHGTMKQVVSEYSGQVAWVYRHFPIAQLHAKAIKEAEATECAAEFGGNSGFWKYIDRVFEKTNSNDSLDPAELPIIAAEIGLDQAAFSACLSSGRHNAKIMASIEEAVKAGARGTPYSVIISQDGKKDVINGAEPIEMIRAKIDALLK